jgi:hypothetical protein
MGETDGEEKQGREGQNDQQIKDHSFKRWRQHNIIY